MTDPPVRCAVCSEPIAGTVTPDEVVTVDGRRLRFRRSTDFVACPRCMTLYRVSDLRAGVVSPVRDDDLIEGGEADRPD